jgi:hypothetical protein
MRLNTPGSMPQSETEVRLIQEQIAALKSRLPPREHESRDPLHAVVVKTFLDGASHSRTLDLNNEWAKAGHGIREAIKQGGEVVVRPLYPGEVVEEKKYYPGRERIKVLEALVGRVARLHPEAGEIGPGMLASLVEESRKLMEGKEY